MFPSPPPWPDAPWVQLPPVTITKDSLWAYSKRHKVPMDDITRLATALSVHARCGCGTWWGVASQLRACDLCGRTATRIR